MSEQELIKKPYTTQTCTSYRDNAHQCRCLICKKEIGFVPYLTVTAKRGYKYNGTSGAGSCLIHERCYLLEQMCLKARK